LPVCGGSVYMDPPVGYQSRAESILELTEFGWILPSHRAIVGWNRTRSVQGGLHSTSNGWIADVLQRGGHPPTSLSCPVIAQNLSDLPITGNCKIACGLAPRSSPFTPPVSGPQYRAPPWYHK
jgi:hypothetical protein